MIFAGALSHGQPVDKAQWIEAIESPAAKYQSFIASDVKVRTFQDTAVATFLWSSRRIVKGQVISSQMRAIHVYISTPSGWHAVSGQITKPAAGRAAAAVCCRHRRAHRVDPREADVTLAVRFSNACAPSI